MKIELSDDLENKLKTICAYILVFSIFYFIGNMLILSFDISPVTENENPILNFLGILVILAGGVLSTSFILVIAILYSLTIYLYENISITK